MLIENLLLFSLKYVLKILNLLVLEDTGFDFSWRYLWKTLYWLVLMILMEYLNYSVSDILIKNTRFNTPGEVNRLSRIQDWSLLKNIAITQFNDVG